MRKLLWCGLAVITLSAQAQQSGPWLPGAIDNSPVASFSGGSVLFSTLGGIAPASFAVNSQRFTVTGGMTGIPAGYNNAAADDFTIPLADGLWQIVRVNVQGAYFVGAGPAESVNVYIIGNSGMLPDTTNLSAGSIYVAENLSYTDAGTGDFEIDLPGGGLNLGPGTYWLVVQANMDAFSGGQWGWRESSASPDTGTAVGFESGWMESGTLFNACVGAWGQRITDCNITQPPNGTPNEPDLAFALIGNTQPPDIIVNPVSGIETNESGATAQFSVSLTAPPTDTVTIPINSNDVTEGFPDTASLMFTAANYNIPQIVTVTGQDDAVADGNVVYSIITSPVSSTDTRYTAITPPNVTLTNFDDEVAGITIFDLFVTVTEGGASMTFDVMANTPPTDDVMLPLALNDASEATLMSGAMMGSAITITLPSGSTAPVTVTVDAIDDLIDDGDLSILMGPGDPSSVGDAIYDALTAADIADVKILVVDNDTAGITVTPSMPEPMQTDEALTLNPTFSVVLDTEPTMDVQIPLFSSDPSEGTLDTMSLTFTPANWNVPQVVTVSGVNDDIDDGTVMYVAVTEPSNSSDPTYQGIDAPDVSLENLDDGDTTGVTVTPSVAEPMPTTEVGGTATFTVVLDSEPIFDVSIDVASDDASEGVTDVASLTFTPANWDTPQTVTVTGQDDLIDDGDVGYNVINSPAVTNDPTYAGFDPNDVSLINEDNDTAGITVSPTTGLVTTEAGGTDTFTVVLDSEPTADVTIDVASDDATEGTTDVAMLTFTSANWDTPQTVTVTGVDDDIDDGDIAFNIVLDPAVSTDPNYNGIDPADVGATNQDNDTAGINVMPTSGLVTDEDGAAATFDVVLLTEPTADVDIALASDDLTEGVTDLSNLTFTAGNWDTPQTVTITGQDDALFDGDIPYNIILNPATSTDPNYNGLDPDDVTVTNLENDFCGPVVIMTQIGAPIVVQGTPGCIFDLYSNACVGDNTQWVLIASGITIGPDGEVTVPGVVGMQDECYVATVTGDINQPLNFPLRTVPTLGEFALIALCGMLMGLGIWSMRRRRVTA